MTVSERSKELLGKLQAKQVTMDQFLKECAYWALNEGFDELKPKFAPSKSLKVMELERVYPTVEKRSEVDWNKILSDFPEVKGYYTQKLMVEGWNTGVVSWLKEVLSYMPETDTISRTRIKNKITEFEGEEIEKVKEAFASPTKA